MKDAGLVDAICTAFAASSLRDAPKPLPDTPYFAFRKGYAAHLAAVAWHLLKPGESGAEGSMAGHLFTLADAAPILHASGEDLLPAATQARADLIAQRDAARQYWRYTYPRKTTAQEYARLLRRLELNDLEDVAQEIASVDGFTPFQSRFLQYKLLERGADRIATDAAARQLQADFPEDSAKAGIGHWHLYRDVGNPKPPARQNSDNPFVLTQHLNLLRELEQVDAGLAVARCHMQPIREHLPLALSAAALLLSEDTSDTDLRRKLVAAAHDLPPIHQPGFFSKFGFGEDYALADLLGQHVSLGMSAFWSLPLINAALASARVDTLPAHVQAALPELRSIDLPQILEYDAGLRASALRLGYAAAQPAADAGRLRAVARFDANATTTVEAVRAATSRQTRDILVQIRQAGRPLMLYSAHTARIGMANYAPSILAADAGFDVVSVAGHDWIASERAHRKAEKALRDNDIVQTVLNTKVEDAASQSARFIDHLVSGGAIAITNDGLVSPGERVTVPWVLRPYVMKTFAAQLALAKQATLAIATEWVDKDDRLNVDISFVDMPPEQGALAVRAHWLTQRCARRIRRIAREKAVPYTLPLLDQFGGAPSMRDVLALSDWQAEPAVRDNMLGWIVAQTPDDPRPALRLPQETLSFGALQQMSLRAVSLFVHFQADALGHAATPRKPSDQHRVALVLPKGTATMALALGAALAGSLVAIVQDDLPTDVIAARLAEFTPHVIVCGATVWTRLTRAHPPLRRCNAQICDDAGDGAALEDILEGFDAAFALPRLAPEQPMFVVFTSGSDGKPKAVVLAAETLSHGTGLDQLIPTEDRSRLAYFTRWDAVGFLDLIASLRGESTLCVPHDDVMTAPDSLARWLADEQVTALSAPVSIWRGLVASRRWKDTPSATLRCGMLWGERLYRKIVEDIETSAPAIDLYCQYGASECSYIAFGPVTTTMMIPLQGSPGGVLVGDTVATPIERPDQPVINGKRATALRVYSKQAMLGYWHDLKDAEPLAHSSVPRSVDIEDNVIVHETGLLEVLGRADSILKVAGHRLAIVAIEQAAETAEGVHRAVLFQTETDAGSELNMAVETSEMSPERDIRDAIASRIGPFAMPRRILPFAQFPQLPSGKVDRKMLRAHCAGEHNDMPAPAPVVSDAADAPDLGQTLNALRDWACRNGHAPNGQFDPDARAPEFTSIDTMELMLLFEERFERGIELKKRQFDLRQSWAGIAHMADQLFGAENASETA